MGEGRDKNRNLLSQTVPCVVPSFILFFYLKISLVPLSLSLFLTYTLFLKDFPTMYASLEKGGLNKKTAAPKLSPTPTSSLPQGRYGESIQSTNTEVVLLKLSSHQQCWSPTLMMMKMFHPFTRNSVLYNLLVLLYQLTNHFTDTTSIGSQMHTSSRINEQGKFIIICFS